MEFKVVLFLPRDAASVPISRQVLDGCLETLGVTADTRTDIALALTEARSLAREGACLMAGAWSTAMPCPDDTCRAAARRGSSHVIAAAIATSAALTAMATTIAETNVPRSGAAPRAA